ncbi:MAG: IPT/TIG domain-containing protein [Planctomycetota bacterium]
MLRKWLHRLTVLMVAFTFGCGGSGDSTDLNFPGVDLSDTGTADVSAQVARLAEGVPDGRRITFVGDVITVRGKNYVPGMNVFFGANLPINSIREDGLFNTPRFLLPNAPFVFTDPTNGQQTTTEVGVPVAFNSSEDVTISVPGAVACTEALTNPTLRFFGDDGSSFPTTDVFHVVGPMAIAITPNKIPDVGGDSVIVHGDFFSLYTQIAFRYIDPASGETVVIGANAETDINEIFIDRFTLVIPDFPGIVPNSNVGLARELKVDILVFENIEEITSNAELEPALGGEGACAPLIQQSNEIPLQLNGVRNSERREFFTFLPTGVTDYPSVAGIVPEFGSEIGLNTVVIHGDQFDGFTVDLSDPDNPGIGIECPPDSGNFIAPRSAVLVDRQTIVIKMPPCEIEVPEKVAFCLTNKFSIDNPVETNGGEGTEIPTEVPGDGVVNGTCVVFDDIYEYIPVPPIAPPVVSAIYPITETELDNNTGNDFGLQKFLVVGDWFDSDTELNGGFEFVLPDGTVIQSLRTVLRNRNLLEVYTERLPDSVYPLSADLVTTVRVRNTIGFTDFPDFFTFKPLPDAGATPELTEICGTTGPNEGGNQIMVIGANFDTTTNVLFSGLDATAVQFVNSNLLIATVPASSDVSDLVGTDVTTSAIVTVVDDGEPGIGDAQFDYGQEPVGPILGALQPDTGSSTGGYDILVFGVDMSPLSRIEFGVGDGNFSPNVYFLSSNLLRVEVPEAFPAQIGATVDVGLTDPLNGLDETIKTVPFTYTAAQQAAPEILFVDTSVEVPITETDLPALNVPGGDRMLIIGRNFDQRTSFDITKPQESVQVAPCTDIEVLTPNIAVARSPASPDGEPGIADLKGHNDFGSSNGFPVEYVEPGPPTIIDVRNLDTGTTDAPIDSNDRLLIFGENFFAPVQVKLTGCDINNQTETIEYIVPVEEIALVEDNLIGVNIPADTFCEGPLDIEVTTEYGTVSFDNESGEPIFQLVGPQPPMVMGVFESVFNSGGGEEAIFFGRNFTSTTTFAVRTSIQPVDTYTPVLSARIVSSSVAIVIMPPLPGGMPPVGAAGVVRSEETDADLANKIAGDPFFVSEELFSVVNDAAPVLLGVFPDHGSILGGEQVLLTGSGFLKATGESNVNTITIEDPDLGPVGTYTEASPLDLPLDSLDPASQGKYVILNDHQILLITNPRAPIVAPDTEAPANVTIEADEGSTSLSGGYTYQNTPAEIIPVLFGITPNETRLNGGTSHLISGGFLTAVDRLIFSNGSDDLTIESSEFTEVNDSFLVFIMPDLTGTFSAGDVLSLVAEKDLTGGTVQSNTINAAIRVTFAGPPTVTATLSPDNGSGFGGEVVKIEGTLFTSNSQVLFGTMPAKQIVVVSPTVLYAVAPTLPVSAPAGGLSLDTLDTQGDNATVDVAVFTQGGWAVVEEAFTFNTEAPTITDCSEGEFTAGETKRVTIVGTGFVPDEIAISATRGTIGNIVVENFETVSFDYTAADAADYGVAAVGPFIESITLETNMGSAPGCEFSINLPPFLTSCESSYEANSSSSPTTGVADGELVTVTLTGGNLVGGGTLRVERGSGTDSILLTEIAGDFTGGGQWKAVNATTIEFTVPNVFSSDVPTLIDGNRNVGTVTISYSSTAGAADLDDCFSYVPTSIDFEDFSFTIPVVSPAETIPQRITAGDINADGVVDMVSIARQSDWNGNDVEDPDAFVYIADTFGETVDVNGDGVTPDFAGTFTRTVIENDTVKTYLYEDARGGKIRLANLDTDDQLELIIPVQTASGSDQARILFVDVDSDGELGTESVYDPTSITSSFTISGIAVGNFDDSHEGVDIAATIGGDESERRILILASDGDAFDAFTDTSTDIDDPFDNFKVGFLEAGDFNDNGHDDLIWGQSSRTASPVTQSTFPVVVVEIDASAADADNKVVSQDALTNFTGGSIKKIEVFDVDGNGNEDAVLIAWDGATGDLLDNERKPAVIAIVLDPLDLEADDFFQTGFLRQSGTLGDGGSNHMASGDFNGDGIRDLAVLGNEREFSVFFGNPVPETIPADFSFYRESGRSWNLITTQPDPVWAQAVDGVAAADFNRDGLDEIMVADAGANPKSIIVWLNTSR